MTIRNDREAVLAHLRFGVSVEAMARVLMNRHGLTASVAEAWVMHWHRSEERRQRPHPLGDLAYDQQVRVYDQQVRAYYENNMVVNRALYESRPVVDEGAAWRTTPRQVELNLDPADARQMYEWVERMASRMPNVDVWSDGLEA